MRIYQVLRIPKDRENIIQANMWDEDDFKDNSVSICVSLDRFPNDKKYSPLLCTDLSDVLHQHAILVDSWGARWDYEIMEVDIPEEML